jgi:hypothetical protein
MGHDHNNCDQLTNNQDKMNLNEQNSEKSLLYLAAQDRIYAEVKTKVWLIYLSAGIPFVALFLRPFFPQMDTFLMISGIVGTIISVATDQVLKNRIKIAARIQEEVDTDVFQMDWNKGIAETKINREEVIAAAGTYRLPPHRLPWYSGAIGAITNPFWQTLLCQRENAAWDWRSKRYMAKRLEIVFWAVIIIALSMGLFSKNADGEPLTMFDWFKTIIPPALGLIVATWKIWRAFLSVGKEREKLTIEIEEDLRAKKSVDESHLRSYQDRIFKTRTENCFMPDWLHKKLQKGFQEQTTRATEMFIEELKK